MKCLNLHQKLFIFICGNSCRWDDVSGRIKAGTSRAFNSMAR